MDEFIEIEPSAETGPDLYRYVDAIRMIGDFYVLWDRARGGDWNAYREMISERFPNEWTYVAPPSCLGDETAIPSEFVMYPLEMDDEPAQRYDLRGVLVPDEYGVSAWLARTVG